MRQNRLGMKADALFDDVADLDWKAFMADLQPSATVHARHTVGLLDPLHNNPEPVGDSLPENLEEVIARYGHRYFKIKVGGNREEDLHRLSSIAAILESRAPDFAVSLDGNEQYADANAFMEFYRALKAHSPLDNFRQRILYIEQPIARSAVLNENVFEIAREKPVIIDESDGDLGAFERAIALGYRGVSSKSCKGVYKSLINLARCRRSGPEYFLSGEDLTMQAGIAVQQDLALVSLLGIDHVERNGHHYVDGFGDTDTREQSLFLERHPDLYHLENDRVRLQIRNGQIAIASLSCPGFASLALPDFAHMDRQLTVD